MNCPADIAGIIVEILRAGILRIRCSAGSGNAARCAIEADHLHNLPQLLSYYAPELLRYYWEIEKPSYISRSSQSDVALFEPLWKELASHVTDTPDRVPA